MSAPPSFSREDNAPVHKKTDKTQRKALFAVPYAENINIVNPITTLFPLAREAQ
jgi:hypothetical protein